MYFLSYGFRILRKYEILNYFLGSQDAVYMMAEVSDHELLKKEIGEARLVLKTMSGSVKERLRAYGNNQQVCYSCFAFLLL